MARTYILVASGVTALCLSIASATLMYILAASLLHPRRQPLALVLLSAVLTTVSCLTWTALVWQQYRLSTRQPQIESGGPRKRHPSLHLIVGIVPSMLAAIITGIALGWSEGNFPDDHIEVMGRPATSWLNVTYVVWGVTLAFQLIHIVAIGWSRRPRARIMIQRLSVDEVPRVLAEARRSMAPSTRRLTQEKHISSPPTLVPSEGPSSIRSSFSTLHQPISRPTSSKKTMLIRQHSLPRHSQRSSFETTSGRPSQDEGFDSWDTSQVSMQIRETLLQSKSGALLKPSLAPIPGSRSPSPAKALEGPFYSPDVVESPPTSPLPQPSVSRPNSPSSPLDMPHFTSLFPPANRSPLPDRPMTSPSGLPRLQTALPPTLSRNDSLPTSSPVLPIMANVSQPMYDVSPITPSEEHIHPLFRTTSPIPAPSASLGTIVTAAPEAGQLISEQGLRRIRSGSLPCITSTLTRSTSSPDISTRSTVNAAISDMLNEPPPIPRRSLSRPSPTPLHQRKRSVSFENGTIGSSKV